MKLLITEVVPMSDPSEKCCIRNPTIFFNLSSGKVKTRIRVAMTMLRIHYILCLVPFDHSYPYNIIADALHSSLKKPVTISYHNLTIDKLISSVEC